MACFNSYGYSTGISASLISASFSLTSGQGKLGFWMLRDGALYQTNEDKVDFMINTTASSTGAELLGTVNRAKSLTPVETGADGWYYYEFTIPASFNTATNYIILKATSAYGNDCYVDDVAINLILANDVGVQSVDVISGMPGTVVPKATVKNYGTAVQTFPVTMTITPGGYTSTKTVTALAANTTNQVTFDNWVASNGAYTVKVITQLGTDADRYNDTLVKAINISASSWLTGAPAPAGVSLGCGIGYTKPGDTAGYFFSICSQSALTACYKYNVKANTWTTIAPFPIGNDRMTGACVGDSLYVFGGNDGTAYLSTVYKYNINANTWTLAAPMPVALGWNKACSYQDSLVYIAGGYTGSVYSSAVYLFNAKTNSYRTATPLPAARFGGGFAKSGDTLVYIAGVDATGIKRDVYKGVISQSDRSIITWTTGTLIPAPYAANGVYRTDAADWGCKGVIISGGSTDPTYVWTSVSNGCLVYSPGADAWTQLANKPTSITAPHSGSVRIAPNQYRFICMGGYNGTTNIPTTEIFADTLGCVLVGVPGNSNQLPNSFSLSQNYPNPFNPSTKINYALKTNGQVTLKIYNILGKEVATIVNEVKNAGIYSVDFNASNLASGVYFYTIKAGDFTDTKKMLLLK
jgi:hypothetical protein